jgi:membrane associated rhomboid family serine protease
MIFPIGDTNIERGHYPLLSYLFLLINTGIFLAYGMQPEPVYEAVVTTYGAIPVEITNGVDWYTLLTSIFLHGSLMHLLGNMLYLWIFADNIEATVGSLKFVFFYLLGGIMAGLIQVVVDPYSTIPCVGASGAIAAVMGAYIVMFPRSQVRMTLFFLMSFNISAWVFLGFWFIQQLSSGIGVLSATDAGGVAWWAHIGGFLFGLIAGTLFRRGII